MRPVRPSRTQPTGPRATRSRERRPVASVPSRLAHIGRTSGVRLCDVATWPSVRGRRDVDQPADAETIGAHAEDVAPSRLLERHRHRTPFGELLEVIAELRLIVAAERHREVRARPVLHLDRRVRRHEPDALRAFEVRVHHQIVLARIRRCVVVGERRDVQLAAPDGAGASLADSVPSWRPFPEVPASLGRLREDGWRLGILSNTDADYLDASLRSIGVTVDERVVASDIGSYKPAFAHWETFFLRTGADRAGHVHVAASLF